MSQLQDSNYWRIKDVDPAYIGMDRPLWIFIIQSNIKGICISKWTKGFSINLFDVLQFWRSSRSRKIVSNGYLKILKGLLMRALKILPFPIGNLLKT